MTLRFLHITDHHLGSSATVVNRGYATAWALERVLEAIAASERHDADFLLCTGDLVDAGTDEEYAFARGLLGIEPAAEVPGPLVVRRPGLEGLPLYIVPGNHDPRSAWLRNLFPKTPPRDPLDLRWDHGDLAFAYLDLGVGGRAGDLREASLAYLDTVLAERERVVVVLHHHPIPVGIPWLDRALPDGIERFWQRCRPDRVVAVVFGHAHVSIEERIDGVLAFGTRSTCFQFAVSETPEFVIRPLQYALVTIDDSGASVQRYEVPLTGAAIAKAVA